MKTLPLSALLAMLCTACSSSSEPSTTTEPMENAAVQQANTKGVETDAVTPIDMKRGFRSHRFGDSISTFSDLVLVGKTEPGMKRYKIKEGKENLHFGEAALNGITYTFYQGVFYSVSLYTTERDGMRKIISEATALYGKPSHQDGEFTDWLGEKVQAATALRGPGTRSDQDTAFLQVTDKVIIHQILEAKQQAMLKMETTR